MRLGVDARTPQIEVIPHGSLAMDLAARRGRNPPAHVDEIFGPESRQDHPKCCHVIANAQKAAGCRIPSTRTRTPTRVYASGWR